MSERREIPQPFREEEAQGYHDLNMVRFSYVAALFHAIDADFRNRPGVESMKYHFPTVDEQGQDVAEEIMADKHMVFSLFRMRNMLAEELRESGEGTFVDKTLDKLSGKHRLIFLPGNVVIVPEGSAA